MKTRTFVSIPIFVVLIVAIFIFASCENGGEVSNTITFGGSWPGVEGYYVFTFDANGVPQSFELTYKMETGASADAGRVLQTITAWRSGTGFFDQIAAYKLEMQNFILADFDDPIPAFNPSSPDYYASTTTLTWSDSLLQEMTTTHDSDIGKWVYDYNVNDTIKAMRKSHDGGTTFTEAIWYQYGDPNFPLLPIEMREFEGGDMSSTYDYASDPSGYKTGPSEMNDSKYIYTPNADDQIAELVEQKGNAWPPTSWTNYSKTVCTYDTSGRISNIDRLIWFGGDWTLFSGLPATYSGSVPSISLEELFFSEYYDFFFVVP